MSDNKQRSELIKEPRSQVTSEKMNTIDLVFFWSMIIIILGFLTPEFYAIAKPSSPEIGYAKSVLISGNDIVDGVDNGYDSIEYCTYSYTEKIAAKSNEMLITSRSNAVERAVSKLKSTNPQFEIKKIDVGYCSQLSSLNRKYRYEGVV